MNQSHVFLGAVMMLFDFVFGCLPDRTKGTSMTSSQWAAAAAAAATVTGTKLPAPAFVPPEPPAKRIKAAKARLAAVTA